MITKVFERGGRNSVYSFGTNEVIKINSIGVGGIFRAGAGPQWTLNPGTLNFEIFPTAACKSFVIFIVGKFRVGDGSLAAQRRIFRKLRIDLGIDTRNE